MSDMWIQLSIMMFQDHGQCNLDEHQKANVCVCTDQGWRLQLHNQQLHSIWLYYYTTCRGEQTDPMISACLKKINAIMRLGGRITWEDMKRVENAVATCKRASSGNCQHVHQVWQKTFLNKICSSTTRPVTGLQLLLIKHILSSIWINITWSSGVTVALLNTIKEEMARRWRKCEEIQMLDYSLQQLYQPNAQSG